MHPMYTQPNDLPTTATLAYRQVHARKLAHIRKTTEDRTQWVSRLEQTLAKYNKQCQPRSK